MNDKDTVKSINSKISWCIKEILSIERSFKPTLHDWNQHIYT